RNTGLLKKKLRKSSQTPRMPMSADLQVGRLSLVKPALVATCWLFSKRSMPIQSIQLRLSKFQGGASHEENHARSTTYTKRGEKIECDSEANCRRIARNNRAPSGAHDRARSTA